MRWLLIKKMVILKCHLLLFYTTTWTISLWWNGFSFHFLYDKWILHNNWRWPAQWLYQEEAPKHFSRQNSHPEKVIVTVWWSAACLIHYSFLNLSETITSEKYAQQINETHWKLTPAASIGQQKGPNYSPWQHPTTCCATNTSKVEQIGLQCFTSPDIFTKPLAKN